MLSGCVSAARMMSSLVPRETLEKPCQFSLDSGNKWGVHVRLGGLVGSLLELAVVAGLLDAVQDLLDEGLVLSLGPGGRLVLARHGESGLGGMCCRRESVRKCQGSLRMLAPERVR